MRTLLALVKDGIPLLSSLTFICGLSKAAVLWILHPGPEILSSYILCSCYDQVSDIVLIVVMTWLRSFIFHFLL